MISFVNITNELLNLARCWPKGAERFFSHKCTSAQNTPAITCARVCTPKIESHEDLRR